LGLLGCQFDYLYPKFFLACKQHFCPGTKDSHLIECFWSFGTQSERTEGSNISNQDGSTVFCAFIIWHGFCRSSYILP